MGMGRKYKAALFDLDGVIVDTAKYHYLAWKELAVELGFDFTEKDNERLKGVSRMRSLEILLEVGGVTLSKEEKLKCAARKNARYIEYISQMDGAEILPGAKECLSALRSMGIKIALGSASKNTPMIVDKLRIIDYFDVIIDGNKSTKAKPDPEVFLMCAKELGVNPSDCVVFEDAEAGIQAAKAAGMYAVGLGSEEALANADMLIRGLDEFDIKKLF
jgi:beta-phosphoglucomutase